jgi:hypothetical protein
MGGNFFIIEWFVIYFLLLLQVEEIQVGFSSQSFNCDAFALLYGYKGDVFS